MKKNLLSILLALSLFATGAIIEKYFVKNSFTEFEYRLRVLYDKTELNSASADDAYSIQKFWHEKKRTLHIIIPHIEIKEIDLWLPEAVKLIDQNKQQDAQQKIEVLLELAEQTPKSYLLKFENIF